MVAKLSRTDWNFHSIHLAVLLPIHTSEFFVVLDWMLIVTSVASQAQNWVTDGLLESIHCIKNNCHSHLLGTDNWKNRIQKSVFNRSSWRVRTQWSINRALSLDQHLGKENHRFPVMVKSRWYVVHAGIACCKGAWIPVHERQPPAVVAQNFYTCEVLVASAV